MRSKKILYIITLPDLGGAQVHLYEIITNLLKCVNCYLIVGKTGWLTDKLTNMKERIYIVESLVRHISLKEDLNAIFKIKKLIDRLRPDLVHCHSSKAGFIGRIAARLCNVPSVFTAHGWAFTDGVSKQKQYIYKFLEKSMSRWTKKIICVSEFDRTIAIKAMPSSNNRIITVHNGIPDIKFSQQGCFECEVLSLVMVARFSVQKDHRLLIQAIFDLNRVNPVFHLTLVGDGPLYEKEKLLVKELGIVDKVSFLGARTDVEKILSTQDVFLLISNWEGFPISILEAMRQGLPVIASDVGGVSEAVEDGVNGFLIPRGNKEVLKQRLLEMYRDKKKCFIMGEKSREKYLLHFSSDEMMNKIQKVYEEILEDNLR